jgi:hypothetical protein
MKNILNWFRKPKLINGVLKDVRPPEEKQKDYLTEEIIAMAQPLVWEDYNTWKEKPAIKKMLNDLEVHSQKNVGSCAAESLALLLAIKNYEEDGVFNKVSSKPIYGNRVNKPSVGMFASDVGKIGVELGSVFESLYPSPNDTDANMSDLSDYITAYQSMAKVLRMKNYFWLYQTTSIDAFAHILALGEPIAITVVFGDGEWTSVPEVKAVVPKYGHMITALQNSYFTYQGKKAIYVQDSHSKDYYLGGRHILTEDWFLKNRIICGMWFSDLKNLEVFQLPENKPHYVFNNDLSFGMNNDGVKKLQECLRYDGEFNYSTNTGYFGGYTLKAVKDFQTKYGIEPVLGYCGILTRTKLNSLFK